MEPSKPPSPSPSQEQQQQQQQQEHTHQESNNSNANPELKTNQNNTKSSTNAPHAMNNFREMVMKIVQASATATLSPTQTLFIEQRLKEYFPDDYHTPDHPPYAAMIHSAIEQLNEEGGSSEEAISDFIKKNNNDLPWAHNALLKHHLSELCKRGEIVEIRDKCYLLGDPTTRTNPISSPSPASSVPASPNLSLSSSSISYSSSCSNSSSSSDFCPKRKRKKRGRPRKKRAKGEQTLVRHTKASKRRGRPSKKNPVSSEEYGSDEQSEEDNTEIESEFYEQEDQANKKHGRKKRRACTRSVSGEENLAMVVWVPGRERGRPRRKLVYEEMQTEATKVAETENDQIEEQNEVTQAQNEVLGKQFEISVQSRADGTNNENVVEEELLEQKREKVVSGNGCKDHEGPKKRRGRPPKNSERGKEIQIKRPRVPGRKPGRPHKNDVLKQEIQMAIEQIEAIQLQDPNVKEINGVTEEDNEPKQEQNQVQEKQFEISEKNLAGEINVVIDTNLHEQEDVGGEQSQLRCDNQNQRLEKQKESITEKSTRESRPGEAFEAQTLIPSVGDSKSEQSIRETKASKE